MDAAETSSAEQQHPTALLRARVIAAASGRARRFWIAPGAFERCVSDHRIREESYERVLSVVEHRRVVMRQVSGGSSGTRRGTLPDAGRTDPWRVDPAHLPARSRVEVDCPDCHGTGLGACPVCRGSQRAPCFECGGSGSVMGARRMKRCPSCRGSGTRRCRSCAGGQVECGACRGTGALTAWLAVVSSRRSVVTVWPVCSSASAHPGVDREDDFDAPSWPSALVSDTGVREPPEAVAPELSPNLRLPEERVVANRRQRFDGPPVHLLRYRLPTGQGSVAVVGERVAPVGTDWRPLGMRLLLVGAAAVLLATAGFVSGGCYLSRHPWFAQHGGGVAFLLVLIGVLAAIAGGWLLGELLLPRRARRGWALAVTALTLVVSAVLGRWAFASGAPEADRARAALGRGDLDGAHLEATALRDLRIDEDAGRDILDAEHLSRVRAQTDLTAMVAIVRQPWERDRPRQEALALLAARQTALAAEFVASRDPTGLDRLADTGGDLLPAASAELRWKAALMRADRCLPQSDFDCVASGIFAATRAGAPASEVAARRSAAAAQTAARYRAVLDATRAKQLPVRRQALTAALDACRAHSLFAAELPDPPPAAIERQLAAVDALLAADGCVAADDFQCVKTRTEQAAQNGAAPEDVQSMRDRATRRAEANLRAAVGRAKREKTPWRRRSELTAALSAAAGFTLVSGRPAPVRVANLQRQIERIDAAVKRERQREERRAAREAERSQRQLERARWAAAPLLCCDGVYSPTCTCGGPRRGCCSWHGGVCGCGYGN